MPDTPDTPVLPALPTRSRPRLGLEENSPDSSGYTNSYPDIIHAIGGQDLFAGGPSAGNVVQLTWLPVVYSFWDQFGGVTGYQVILTPPPPAFTLPVPAPTANVYFSEDRGLSWTKAPTSGILPTTATVARVFNLQLNTSYEFTIRALFGNSPYPTVTSIEGYTAAVVPRLYTRGVGLGSAPLLTSALAGNGRVTLTWISTPDLGGRRTAPTNFVAERRVALSTASWSSVAVGLVNTYAFTGLTNGTAYEFRLSTALPPTTGTPYTYSPTAIPPYTSNFSPTVTVIPFGPSSAPTSLSYTMGIGSITLRWQPPTNSGGRPITGYVVQYRLATVTAWTDLNQSLDASARSALVAGLTSGRSYVFRVAAVTEFGIGTYATWSALTIS